MSEPKRYWISDHGMAESECGAWVHYDDWLKLEEARFALEFRLELATKRNAELHALHETVVRERDGLARDCDGLRAELNFARDDIRALAVSRDELRRALDEAEHAKNCKARQTSLADGMCFEIIRDEDCNCFKSRIPRAGGES